MKHMLTVASIALLSWLSAVPQDAKDAAAWSALGAAVPTHKYPQKARFQRSPEPKYDEQLAALDRVLARPKGAAPETVANFKKLVQSGQSLDPYFHRVVAMQRIPGGCPNTKKDNRARDDDGMGSLGYDLPIEMSTAMHTAGAVSMVRVSGKD